MIYIVTALVLLKIAGGKENAIINETLKIFEVKEVYLIMGTYDIALKIEVQTVEELNKLITRRIRLIEGIIETNTLIAIRVEK